MRLETSTGATDAASTTSSARPLDIVCIATRELNNPLPTNVQHLMRRLAGRHHVLYVEPATDPVHLIRRRRGHAPAPSEPGLDVVRPLVLPWGHRVPGIRAVNRRLVLRAIGRRIRRLGFGRPVLWLFTPGDAWMAGRFRECVLCYHVTDDYPAMPIAAGDPEFARADAELIRRADCVFVTSPHLARTRGLDDPRIHVVPNVADVEHFRTALAPTTAIPDDVARLPRPIAGFVGAVDAYKVDVVLLRACALAAPDISWVLVGPVAWSDPTTRLDTLDLPNVYRLGARPFATLPAYLKSFDVALIPYRLTPYTRATSPLKLWEYLAAGRAVVATDLPGVSDAGDLVTIARDAEQFVAAVRRHAEDGSARAAERAAAAASHSWPRRVAEIETIVLAAVEAS